MSETEQGIRLVFLAVNVKELERFDDLTFKKHEE